MQFKKSKNEQYAGRLNTHSAPMNTRNQEHRLQKAGRTKGRAGDGAGEEPGNPSTEGLLAGLTRATLGKVRAVKRKQDLPSHWPEHCSHDNKARPSIEGAWNWDYRN